MLSVNILKGTQNKNRIKIGKNFTFQSDSLLI